MKNEITAEEMKEFFKEDMCLGGLAESDYPHAAKAINKLMEEKNAHQKEQHKILVDTHIKDAKDVVKYLCLSERQNNMINQCRKEIERGLKTGDIVNVKHYMRRAIESLAENPEPIKDWEINKLAAETMGVHRISIANEGKGCEVILVERTPGASLNDFQPLVYVWQAEELWEFLKKKYPPERFERSELSRFMTMMFFEADKYMEAKNT